MRHAAGVALAIACAVLGAACSSARVADCPGEPIVKLPFHAVLQTGAGGCAFAVDADRAAATGVKTTFDVTGTVATASTGETILCLERPEATPLRGTLDGEHLLVSGPLTAAYVNVCACPMHVAETLDGTLRTMPDGSISFGGTLRNVLSVDGGDPATCEPAPTAQNPGPQCGAPCELHWTVTASR